MTCENGELLPWRTFCQSQNQCPVKLETSETAILVNCTANESHHCPDNNRVSKLCDIDPDTSIERYCLWGKEACPQTTHGPAFYQCYYE